MAAGLVGSWRRRRDGVVRGRGKRRRGASGMTWRAAARRRRMEAAVASFGPYISDRTDQIERSGSDQIWRWLVRGLHQVAAVGWVGAKIEEVGARVFRNGTEAWL